MTYINNYGFNLGDRSNVLGNFDRGQRASKYFRLLDPSLSQAKEGLVRFNFDSVGFNDP